MRIGIIGFGSMGKTHAYAIEAVKYFYAPLAFSVEIAGVAVHSARGKEAVLACGLRPTTTEELLADPTIDAIDICTPNNSHYDLLKRVIAAGKHVLCEKPLCTSLDEATEIERLAKEKQVIGQIVFNNRFLSPILRAKSLIDEGKLGRILSFRGEYLHDSCCDPKKVAGWKQDRTICGGGVLYDLGSHVIDLIYYLCGRFRSVVGQSQIGFETRTGRDGSTWKTNADEAFHMLATLENGAIGTISVSKLALGANDDLKIEIHGTKGAISFSLMEPNWLYYFDGSAQGGALGGSRGYQRIECVGRYPSPGGVFPGVKAPNGWLRGHIGSMYAFLEACHCKKDPAPSFTDAVHVQWVMEEAYRTDLSKGEGCK